MYEYTPPSRTAVDFEFKQYTPPALTSVDFTNNVLEFFVSKETAKRYGNSKILKSGTTDGDIDIKIDGSVIFSKSVTSDGFIDISSLELDRDRIQHNLEADFTPSGNTNPSYTTPTSKITVTVDNVSKEAS